MKRKSVNVFLMVLITTFLTMLFTPTLFGASQKLAEEAKYGGTLTIAMPFDFKSLDSRYFPGSGSEGFGQQILYNRMAEYSAEGAKAIVPALAESWKQIDDKTWLVQIRKGVKFHSGKEMTAEDIRQNIDWKLNRSKYSKERGWRPPRVRSSVNHLKSVEAIDKYTLKFVLEIPFAPFPNWTMNWCTQGVIDPDVVEKYERQATLHPVGTGPFKFVDWVSGDHATMERFDDFWGAKAYLDRVVFRVIPDGQTRLLALQTGEIDVAVDLPLNSIPLIKKDPKLNYYVTADATRTRGGVVYFNVRRWPMNSLKFRQAVLMGADWLKIAKTVFPPGSFVPHRTPLKGSWAENPEAEMLAPSYNPQKAKELIQQLKKEAGKPIPRVEGFVQSTKLVSTIMQIAAQQLKQVGIDLKVNVVEHTVLLDTYRRNPRSPWDIMLHNQKGAGIDPYTVFYELSTETTTAGDGKNISGYSNPEYDELIQQGVSTSDRKAALKIYHQLEKMALQELIAIPFYNLPRLVGYKNTVHDLGPHDSYFVFLHSPWNNVWKEK